MNVANFSILISTLAVPAAGVVALTTANTMDVSDIREAPPPRELVSFSRAAPQPPLLASMRGTDDIAGGPALLHAARVATAAPPRPRAPWAPAPAEAKAKAKAKAPAAADPAAFGVSMSDAVDAPRGAARLDLFGAITGAVGDRAFAQNAAEARPSTAIQLRPAPGAVMASLRAVLPSARKCLAVTDAEMTARVTFRSDGSVANVAASSDCVRAAVAKARVEPFTDESFTTVVVVRPDDRR